LAKSPAIVNLISLPTIMYPRFVVFFICFVAIGLFHQELIHAAPVPTKPLDGYLLGNNILIDGQQITTEGAANGEATHGRKELQVIILPAKGRQYVFYKPATSTYWDLRNYLAVEVEIRNTGTIPVTPVLRIESASGATDSITAAKPLAVGETSKITVPFSAQQTWTNQDKKSGDKIASDTVRTLELSATPANSEQNMTILSARAIMPPPQRLPDWLDKRPPADGDWTLSFEDNFDGDKIDESKWHYYGDNYWDKSAHFSKDNTFVKDGFAHLRFEKKRGHHEDNPAKAETPYATGFLETYGKWTQRYGYFEARVKPPAAPGLWPAFWMMPDRGKNFASEKWNRQDTYRGGMEFDIYEFLTRWGPYRYNIALHWDGIKKDHKMTGSDRVYAQPDKDGFLTCGLLWLPGQAIFYCNGKEVLRYESDRVSNVESGMIFTLPSGGWDNSVLDDQLLPADFVIDYVRVWQRKDLAAPEDGFHQDTNDSDKK
jgi:beta-glucanase (GH16 family)